jgi:hypothetical protein
MKTSVEKKKSAKKKKKKELNHNWQQYKKELDREKKKIIKTI